ncbi:hypothetical protein ABK040_014838 [Willaertia magna]
MLDLYPVNSLSNINNNTNKPSSPNNKACLIQNSPCSGADFTPLDSFPNVVSQPKDEFEFVTTPYSEGVLFHNQKDLFYCGNILKDPVTSLHRIYCNGQSIKQVIACRHSIFVLTTTGKLIGCRQNEMVVYPEEVNSKKNVDKLVYEIPFDKPIKFASNGGGKHFYVQTEDGLYAIGDDSFGQLGLGYSNIISTPKSNTRVDNKMDGHESESTTFYSKFVKVPIEKVMEMEDHEILKIECGLNHTILLMRNIRTGKKLLVGVGCSYYGQTGLNSTRNRNRLSVLEFNCEHGEIMDVKCNCNGTFVLTPKAIYYCGINDHNIVATNKAYAAVLTEVGLVSSISRSDSFKSIVCGYQHCIVITERNKMFGLGRATTNQFGNGVAKYYNEELDNSEFKEKSVVTIVCGQYSTIFFVTPLIKVIEGKSKLEEDFTKLRKSNNFWDTQIFNANKDYSTKVPSYLLKEKCSQLLKYDKQLAPKSKECLDCIIDFIYFNEFKSATKATTPIDLLEWLTVNHIEDEYIVTMTMNAAISLTQEETVFECIQYIIVNKYPKDAYPLSLYWHHALSFCKQYIVENQFGKIKNSSSFSLLWEKQNILVEIARLNDPKILTEEVIQKVKAPPNISAIIASLFDDSTTSDIKLVLDRTKGFIIYCHKSILNSRCEYFNFQKLGFQAAALKEIDVYDLFKQWKTRDQVSYDDFQNLRTIIQYFYTGSIEITTTNAMGILLIWEALGIADESNIFSTSQDFIARSLRNENVLSIIFTIINRDDCSGTKAKSIKCNYSTLEFECLNYCASKWKSLLSMYKYDILNYLTKEQLLKITSIQNKVLLE